MQRKQPKQKRVICPNCKGTRMIWGTDESDHTRTRQLCDFCNGEGIVLKKWNVEYLVIEE
jgi:DnaJ-class molecular chaperone